MPVGSYSLEFGCTSIADPNRTAQYVANAQNPAYCVNGANLLAPEKPSWTFLDVACQCPALQWISDEPGEVPVPVLPYTTPKLDIAPWYSPLNPESAFFHGFIIEKIEDLSTNSVSRAITNRATRYGGGTLGSLRKLPRKFKVTLLAFGNNECALDYAFRWLSDTLTYQCNDDCGLCDATVRTCCPELDPLNPTYKDWDRGRWTFKNVGIIDGPKYEDGPTDANRCNVRRISFTLASESPYAYKCPVVCMKDQILVQAIDACPPVNWICGEGRRSKICCRTENSFSIGDDGILVVVNANEDLYNLKISLTQDIFGYECGTVPAPAGYSHLAPCAEILIPFLPSGYTLRYDTGEERITVILPGGLERDGTPYVDASTGQPPTFPSIRCGGFCVCLTVDRCGFSSGGSTASIYSQHRELAI